MKRTHRFALATAAITLLVALIFITGCESSTDYAIDVTPPYADLSSRSPRVTLSAKGWSDYMWKLKDPEIGFLSSTHGESVIYTAVVFSESKTQVVTVNARNIITGGGTSGSNSVSHAYTGQVIIRHL